MMRTRGGYICYVHTERGRSKRNCSKEGFMNSILFLRFDYVLPHIRTTCSLRHDCGTILVLAETCRAARRYIPSFRDEWREAGKVRTCFACLCEITVILRRRLHRGRGGGRVGEGEKGEIGNGGRRATSSVTRVSHMYYRRASRQSNRCKDRVTLHAHSL